MTDDSYLIQKIYFPYPVHLNQHEDTPYSSLDTNTKSKI